MNTRTPNAQKVNQDLKKNLKTIEESLNRACYALNQARVITGQAQDYLVNTRSTLFFSDVEPFLQNSYQRIIALQNLFEQYAQACASLPKEQIVANPFSQLLAEPRLIAPAPKPDQKQFDIRMLCQNLSDNSIEDFDSDSDNC